MALVHYFFLVFVIEVQLTAVANIILVVAVADSTAGAYVASTPENGVDTASICWVCTFTMSITGLIYVFFIIVLLFLPPKFFDLKVQSVALQ